MRLDEMYYTEIEMEGMKEILKEKEEYIKKLREENQKLKKELEIRLNANKILRMHDAKMEYDNKKLSEENGQLKSDLAFKNTMLDNVSAEYESSQDVIRKLNRRIKELEQCNLNLQTWIDNKEKVNKSLREENKRLSDFLECEA